jgi:D-alanyl-lipoteichoic acid acyltransferase DltB (MBOAT superfamily)
VLFNSPEFLLFAIVVLGLYHGVLRRAAWATQKGFLVVVSYLFYMSWYPPLVVLLLGSTLVDYALGLRLERTRTPVARRALLVVSLAFNLGVLGFFKYGGFLAQNLVWAFGGGDPPFLDVVLPVGISFYTFESLSYTINVYRGEAAYRSLLDFALFLSFFPHLVAGPIVRPRAFLPQLASRPGVAPAAVEPALARIAQGFVKKVVLADTLGVYVDMVWGRPGELPALGGHPAGNVLLGLYAYAFQIYFDFSGYTDIALGLAQLFGFTLPENFARPYLAASPREFWQRWHITLSTWLRDYLYVSLGGNRRGPVRTYVNLLVTMLLGGLWHGAAWSFVLWGGYHGGLLAAHRWWRARRPARDGALRLAAKRLGTFHLVVLGWVLFRMPSVVDGWRFLRGGLRPGYEPTKAGTLAMIVVATGVLLHVAPPAVEVRRRFVRLPPLAQGVAYGLATVVGFLVAPAGARFIYFQF